MRNIQMSRRTVLEGVAAIATVAAGILLASEMEVEASVAIPPAPDAIDLTSIGAPELTIASDLDDLRDIAFAVPVLDRAALRLPEPPAIEVAGIRAEAVAWLGDGVLPAPTTSIQGVPPDLKAIDELNGPEIEVPTLERPALPELPPIR